MYRGTLIAQARLMMTRNAPGLCRFFTIRQRVENGSIREMHEQPKRNFSRDRIFYTGVAIAFACSVFIGFSRTYYLKPLFGTPPLSILAHVHGALFTAWTAFFVLQAALVAAGRTDLHRRTGVAGAMLAAAVVSLGTAMAFHPVRAGYASGRPNMGFLLVNSIIDLFLFSSFLAAGLFFRRNKEIHKRLMVLAMVSLIIPSFARLPIPFTMIGWVILAFSLTGVAYDGIFLRRVYVTNVVGALLINVATPLRFAIAGTRAWQDFVEWVAR